MVFGARHENYANGIDEILKIYNSNTIFHEIIGCRGNKWLILETWRHVTDTATSNKSIIKI
jgi:hypothetical protein